VSTAAATREEIARLFGRAAFGATAADLDAWTGKPYAQAVDHLLAIPPPDQRGIVTDEPQRQILQQSGTAQLDVTAAQRWWLERMRITQYPLEERMTLFWHGHFATAARDPFPDVAMLMRQNETLRRNAFGNFRDLVAAMTLDPAMLEWLDGSRNTIPVPNENYARELLELFTLGKYPQVYTEADVREGARVLTGWTLNTVTHEVRFEPTLHDVGNKTVLGTTIGNQGAAEYLALVDTALKQPVSPRFIAYKMVANFGYAPSTDNLLDDADPLVAKVGDALRRSGWSIREGVRTMLLSDEFRTGEPSDRRLLVRSPVETLVASAKALGVAIDNDNIAHYLAPMGQPIFRPANVGGWPVGTNWLSPSSALARYEWAVFCQGKAQAAALPPSSDLDAWAHLLGLAPLTQATVAQLRHYLDARAGDTEAERQASILVLLLSAPEWTVI
jgi:uncharacterized protein (DUF1800 family)